MVKTLKTLFSFHLRYWPWVITTYFLLVTIALTSSLYPYFYRFFVDTVTTGQLSKLIGVASLFLVVIFLDNFLDIVIGLTYDKFLGRSMADARIKIFEHIQNLDFAFHAEKNTGSLISAFKRGDGAFMALSDVVNDIIRIVTQFIILIISFTIISPKYAIIAIVLFTFNALIMRLMIPFNISRRREFSDEEDRVSAHITENFLNYDTVKFFAKEKREIVNLRKLFIIWRSKFWSYGTSFRLIDLSGTVQNVIGYGAVLFFLINDLQMELIDLGQFVLVLGFLNSFFPQMRSLFNRFRNIAKNYADIEKYFNLLDETVAVTDPEHPKSISHLNGGISFENVTFNYKNRSAIIRKFNLIIKPGESVALVGRSGSGKTTLTKLVMRFYDPQEGIITLDSVDIKQLKKEQLRSFMGVVPQEPILFNHSIAYNIGYGHNRPTTSLIKKAARMANLDQFIESLPEKYETIVGERGIKLSGGQKQRLAIARMLLSDPKIIIFDEATSNLDSTSEKLIHDAFWKIAKKRTTIIIAHRLSTVRRADRIIVLDKGKIVEEGTHNELIKNPKGHYKKLWELQVEGLIDQ